MTIESSMKRIIDPNSNGTAPAMEKPTTQSNVNRFPSTSELNPGSTDFFHGTNMSGGASSSSGNSREHHYPVSRIFSPPLYSLLPSENHNNNNQHNNNRCAGSESQLSISFVDNQDSSKLNIPPLLSMSTNASATSWSTSSSNPQTYSSSIGTQISNRSLTSSGSAGTGGAGVGVSTDTIPTANTIGFEDMHPISNQSPPPNINFLGSRSRSRDEVTFLSPPVSPVMKRGRAHRLQQEQEQDTQQQKLLHNINKEQEKANEKARRRRAICSKLGKSARKENDAMVYLDGPRIYTCGECRTHLTSHDEIISKSFHGRHGRAYLFDQCVNITIGPAEDRRLITGLHSVCDISCKRCKTLIGWTYAKAYEQSQKYKEGKYIIEKIHLHMEESDCYNINLPAGEKRDRWRIRSMSWSSDHSINASPRSPSLGGKTVYEYRSRSASSSSWKTTPKLRSNSISGSNSIGSPMMSPAFALPPSPPNL